MCEASRLHHLADCWRRLAEASSFDQKSYRLAWAEYLDCLARLDEGPARMAHSGVPRQGE